MLEGLRLRLVSVESRVRRDETSSIKIEDEGDDIVMVVSEIFESCGL